MTIGDGIFAVAAIAGVGMCFAIYFLTQAFRDAPDFEKDEYDHWNEYQ